MSDYRHRNEAVAIKLQATKDLYETDFEGML